MHILKEHVIKLIPIPENTRSHNLILSGTKQICLSRDIDYRDLQFPRYSSASLGKCLANTLNLDLTAFLHAFSNSFSTTVQSLHAIFLLIYSIVKLSTHEMWK
jgi:hypothetical protein